MLRYSTAMALAFALFMSTVSAGQAQETVSATVTVQTVSITVTPNSVNYGVLSFQDSRPSNVPQAGNVTFTATNTGNGNESFLVHGANATGSSLSWTLISGTLTCPSVLNEFRHSVRHAPDPALFMTTSDQTLVSGIAPLTSIDFFSEIYTPCNGSSGLGQTASTAIVVTAVAP